MTENLTPEQQAEVIVHKIIQATKDRIVSILEPQFDKIANGHLHFDKGLANAILTDIKNA
ncbi:MAG: hypothetical protein EBU66_19820 [Bacteroidetes bacterium]|jgi:hypothetical protein|nr:hypothetical protein [bacterium]NBP66879.1 hypothetical protein [Bacteroidota bacterium]